MKYNIAFIRYGFAEIEASSKREAYAIARAYKKEDISWSDKFCASNVPDPELNADAFADIAKRLNLTISPYHSAHGFIGDICKDCIAIHLRDSTEAIMSKGCVAINTIPPFDIKVEHLEDFITTSQRTIDIWEYSDISKAIAEVENFISQSS